MFGLSNPQSQLTQQNQIIELSTPYVAASDGDLNLLQKSLAELQMPLMTPDENGLTILHSAAAYNHIPVLQWILSQLQQQQVNCNVPDSDGDTPLMHCDHVEAAKILINVGRADASIRNKEGKTALQVKTEEYEENMEEGDDEDGDQRSLRVLIEYLKQVEEGMNL